MDCYFSVIFRNNLNYIFQSNELVELNRDFKHNIDNWSIQDFIYPST